LEGSSVRESKFPWSNNRGLVHGVEVKRSIFLRLSTGEEDDTWEGRYNSSRESSDSKVSNLLGAGLLSVGGTFGYHIRLQKKTLNDKFLVNESSHDSGEDSLRGFGADLNAVVTVGEDLRLNDGHKTVVLADASVSGKRVSGLTDGNFGWSSVTDLADSSPLGESATFLVESLASSGETVKTLSGLLVLGSTDDDKTLIDLNTSEDSAVFKVLNEVLSVSG